MPKIYDNIFNLGHTQLYFNFGLKQISISFFISIKEVQNQFDLDLSVNVQK